MKMKKIACIFGVVTIMSLLTSCAAGSATAGYALKAREADCLTAAGEQRITNRVKREVLMELGQNVPCDSEEYCN